MTRKAKPRKLALRFVEATKDHGAARGVGPVDLRIKSGEAVALLGHNGSGKSTLLAMAAGALDPSEGKVTVFGETAGTAPARAAVSYVADHPVLYQDISVREHLHYLTRLHGTTPEAQDAERVVAQLGLADRLDDVPAALSRGLRQKAALAIALCRPFGIILIDEPFAGLDPAGKAALLSVLAERHAEGSTIIVATHDLSTNLHFQRAVVLSEGAVAYDGEPSGVPSIEPPKDADS